MGQAVGFINGERWRAVRKCVDPLLTNKIAMSQLAQINQSGVEFVARIKETRIDRSGSHTQFTVNAAKTLMPFPLLETTRIFFGDLTGEEQKEMWDIGQIFMLISITTLRAGLSRTAPTKLMYTPFQFGIGREYTKRWKAWNVKMREARSDRRQLPIMKLWQDVRAGKITETEVGTCSMVGPRTVLTRDTAPPDRRRSDLRQSRHHSTRTCGLLHHARRRAAGAGGSCC